MEKLKVFEVQQKEYKLLVFTISAKLLLDITHVKERARYQEDGIQRDLSVKRVKEIAEYLAEDEAALPNNIIINLDLQQLGLTYDNVIKTETINLDEFNLPNKEKDKLSELMPKSKFLDYNLLIDTAKSKGILKDQIGFIIDGQHRLQSFTLLSNPFDIVVTAFIDLTLAEIAEFFVKINYYQTKVNRSQVYDLLGINKDIFPKYYVIHDAVKDLNNDLTSPFYQSIKMLGVGPGLISQASIINALINYKVLSAIDEVFFSNDFGQKDNSKDAQLYKDVSETIFSILWYFFTSLKIKFPQDWGEKQNMLSKSIGIRALLKMLKEIIIKFSGQSEYPEFNIDYVNSFVSRLPNDFIK